MTKVGVTAVSWADPARRSGRQLLRRTRRAKVNPTRALDALCLAERGDPDRCEFRSFLPAGGCIDRPHDGIVVRRSGEIHRPQFGAVKSVVKLMTLGRFRRAAFVTNVEPFSEVLANQKNSNAHDRFINRSPWQFDE